MSLPPLRWAGTRKLSSLSDECGVRTIRGWDREARDMFRCECCERRLGHCLEPCDCSQDYCPNCLLCVKHCTCEEAALAVERVASGEFAGIDAAR